MNPTEIREKWSNLGIAFASPSRARNADPEKTLIESLALLKEDRKLLQQIISWLHEFGNLVHVERLRNLAKNLSPLELAWLGVLSEYMKNERGDHRFELTRKLAQEKLGSSPPVFEDSSLHRLHYERSIEKGAYPAGSNFGLLITQADLRPEPKKIENTSAVLKKNLWICMRMLMGCNWRADIATVMALNLCKNYYQAQKILGCSIETAHRNWNTLESVKFREFLKLEAYVA